ncbi:molybdenum cofactor guanylyltransferase [Methanogenium sp. MK-MG]|uniref:molybdenum cofactor guanylyltransferase n=1 Tax=Methanogenium sp. MK-MG TaxID=2599926 RepID=UPI0020B13F24|nr:molybdenum cofactor guanylyltransferase [Methanogenium sp. MK-MG]KAF1078261.1 Molybdenum cofactor guanylyltransferase [Methanogenium sp. MK-MG]
MCSSPGSSGSGKLREIRDFSMRSGIILAGGEARRAGGKEKYFFNHCGETFISRLVSTLNEIVDEVIIVARDNDQCRRFSGFAGVRVVPDLHQGRGPVGGIHAGVCKAEGDLIFAVACDMPCVSGAVIEYLFRAAEGFDAAIPRWENGMTEPLHAVYRRQALVERFDGAEAWSMRDLMAGLAVHYVDCSLLRQYDPDLLTFTNINHADDLARLRAAFPEE